MEDGVGTLLLKPMSGLDFRVRIDFHFWIRRNL
jgi:hypothetical protein